jgi:hypothetical protein
VSVLKLFLNSHLKLKTLFSYMSNLCIWMYLCIYTYYVYIFHHSTLRVVTVRIHFCAFIVIYVKDCVMMKVTVHLTLPCT